MRVAVILASVVLGGILLAGVRAIFRVEHSRPTLVEPRGLPDDVPGGPGATLAAEQRTVERFCSTCHLLPPPECEPKRLWPDKIKEMYGYATGARAVAPKEIPPIEVPIDHFVARAPEELDMPDDALNSPPSPLPFATHRIALPVLPDPPAISGIRTVQLDGIRPPQLLVNDMRHGLVVLWDYSAAGAPAKVIAKVPHPTHSLVVDLDGDGLRDILLANLGDFWPVDTTAGSVVWLRNRGGDRFESYTLLGQVGRVNDVQAADFDGDGDLDLVVGVFGNLTTGMIAYLENCTTDYAHPDFEMIAVDYSTGTSDLPVTDLNGDGRPDFVALQSQERDWVIAFLNEGGGNFTKQRVYQAPFPRWGSTGILLVDMDGDGDMDVLWNHGDSVQIPPIPRPYHGISWLENRGSYPYVYHRIAHMPGAHTSIPADLDGDGDIDLVTSAFIPAFNPRWPRADSVDSIAWLEQVSAGIYRRYRLEGSQPFHPVAEVVDLDGDGDADIVTGNFIMFQRRGTECPGSLTILENRRIAGNRPDAPWHRWAAP